MKRRNASVMGNREYSAISGTHDIAKIGGQTTLIVAPLGSALPQVQAGSLRAFAVTSEQRAPQLPSVPTVAEAGFPGLNFMLWYAL
jgi:tripartite-type tricarboxylate transporter receptor subunit TctC